MSGVAVENGRLEDGSSGAGMYLAGSATLTTVAFAGNTTLGADGGGLAVVGGVVALENVDFTGNVVGPDDGGFSGAAIHLAGSTLTEYWGGTLTGNRGSFDGGSAVVHVDAGSVADLNVDITDNEAAGIWNEGTLGLFGTSIVASANALEGGLVNHGVADLQDTSITGNVAARTGGVYNTGTIETFNTFIEDNAQTGADVAGSAGGVANVGGTFVLLDSGVFRNAAAGAGSAGGIYSSGELRLANAGVVENESPEGGGVYLDATGGEASLTMRGSVGVSIRGNRAAGDGGGVYVAGPGLIVIEDADVADMWIHKNVADADEDGSGNGGGIFHTGLAPGSVVPDGTVFDNVPDDVFGPAIP